MGSGKLRFGCHDFLNSKPFTFPFLNGFLDSPFDTVFASPSKLSDMLFAGELDIAFIPSIEYARIPNLKIVPNFSIASTGEVKTVLMFSKGSVWNIYKVAVDRRSRTSVALLKVLFKEFYRSDVSIVNIKSREPEKMLHSADAGLLIGDEAFGVGDEYNVTDLSQAWFAFTGKPFVFAVLCVRDGVDASEAIKVLNESRAVGLEKVDDICKEANDKTGLDVEICRDYLEKRISYNLSGDELEGLTKFYELAEKHGFIESIPEFDFYL